MHGAICCLISMTGADRSFLFLVGGSLFLVPAAPNAKQEDQNDHSPEPSAD